MKQIVLFIAILCITAACTPTTNTRGNYILGDDIARVRPQETTQNEVLRLLGSPTSKAVFDDNTWYYVGLKTEKESFFDEDVTDRQVYKITFNDEGIVQQIDREAGEPVEVPIASRVTPTTGNEVTFIQQILGNLGKFNKPTQN